MEFLLECNIQIICNEQTVYCEGCFLSKENIVLYFHPSFLYYKKCEGQNCRAIHQSRYVRVCVFLPNMYVLLERNPARVFVRGLWLLACSRSSTETLGASPPLPLLLAQRKSQRHSCKQMLSLPSTTSAVSSVALSRKTCQPLC